MGGRGKKQCADLRLSGKERREKGSHSYPSHLFIYFTGERNRGGVGKIFSLFFSYNMEEERRRKGRETCQFSSIAYCYECFFRSVGNGESGRHGEDLRKKKKEKGRKRKEDGTRKCFSSGVISSCGRFPSAAHRKEDGLSKKKRRGEGKSLPEGFNVLFRPSSVSCP